jgi:hypothetical protein
MNILQDILGLITKGKVKPPTGKDYMVVASYTDAQEVLKPQPKMQANLVSLAALKNYVLSGIPIGGSQTLTQTLALGNTTDGQNILVNNADAIELENTSKLSKGVRTESGGGGIALTCAVGFEWKFEAGEAYLTDITNGYIELKQYARSLPTVDDDITKGYVGGSKWYGNNFTYFYECTNPTEGAAIWEFKTVELGLQQVTDVGATTDNTIYVSDGTNETSIQIGQVQILDGLGSYSQIAAQGAGFVNGDGTGADQCSIGLSTSWGDQITGLFLSTQDGTSNAALEIKLPPEYYTDLPIENIVSNYFIPFKPSGDYTLATLDDIPTPAYKVYTALISQSGVLNPTLVILENTLGQTVTAFRSAPGRYSLNVTGSILLITKTWWTITNDNNNGHLFYMNKDNSFGNTNTVYIDTTIIGGAYTDGVLQSTPIEIRVYN